MHVFAAVLLIMISAAHSYLGERYLLIRLFRREDLPRLLGSETFTKAVLRFAWHITSVAWLGFAAILVILANHSQPAIGVARAVSVTFFVSAAVSLFGSRGRHYSWIVFLAVATLAWFGA